MLKQVIANIFQSNIQTNYIVESIKFRSKYLDREVTIDLFLPKDYHKVSYSSLYFNDGQDMRMLKMNDILNELVYQKKEIEKVVVIAIHTCELRMREYGITGLPDYKNRGDLAGNYSLFITNELMPLIRTNYNVKRNAEHTAIAGCSLGGLSAFDIMWNNEEFFSKVGVFSGSFWWRDKPFTSEDPDGGRIIHDLIEESQKRKGLKFWFQVGTNDETSDRNNNGVIDSIDDTVDLINLLKNIGYTDKDITFEIKEGGEHHPHTWAEVLPSFLQWAFKK